MLTDAEIAARYVKIRPYLDERQRRLWLGVEAQALGSGGVAVIARATGADVKTVRRGTAEIESGAEPGGRVRGPGGGRPGLAELDAGLVPALEALVDPATRGDPMSPLRWTTKSTAHLAGELTRQGHAVTARTVASLLAGAGYSLQGNAKTIEGKQHPDRDAQFRYINEAVTAFQDEGSPVISVDAKKKENVGNFRNGGAEWAPAGQPERVSVHDFPDEELGKVTPYGIYDLTANTGWVNVGTDHDTGAFAVASIRSWWTPSPASSPWILRYPQPGFSRASRRTSARMLRRVAGRPVLPRMDLAPQRRRTRSRCRRTIVSGVTSSRSAWRCAFGITLSRAASRARSAQLSLGRRGCCRCRTASWWRRIKISAVFHVSSRRASRSHAEYAAGCCKLSRVDMAVLYRAAHGQGSASAGSTETGRVDRDQAVGFAPGARQGRPAAHLGLP